MYTKILNLRKEVGIALKSKETSNQLKPVRNSYVAIMHQPVIVRSNTQQFRHLNLSLYYAVLRAD